VLLAHLHAVCRDPPFSRAQIDLGPLCRAELARAHEYQRRQFQCGFDDRVAAVSVERPGKLCDLAWVCDRRPIRHGHRRQSAPEIGGGIALPSRDRSRADGRDLRDLVPGQRKHQHARPRRCRLGRAGPQS
jgi:hypothetical protein